MHGKVLWNGRYINIYIIDKFIFCILLYLCTMCSWKGFAKLYVGWLGPLEKYTIWVYEKNIWTLSFCSEFHPVDKMISKIPSFIPFSIGLQRFFSSSNGLRKYAIWVLYAISPLYSDRGDNTEK